MQFPKERLASIGSLLYKALGKDRDQLGIVVGISYKLDNDKLPYYVVMTDDGLISEWMTCFVDVINEP